MSSLRPFREPHPLRNVLDALIIGGGPAGLSAALALGRVSRSAVVFDSRQHRNDASDHVHAIPLADHESPSKMRSLMREELRKKYKTIVFTDKSAMTVQETRGVFEVIDELGESWKGRKIIMATGSYDILPDISGFPEAWGKGM